MSQANTDKSLVYRNANLNIFPPKLNDDETNHVTLGDLHGSALKLIYTMLEEGVMELVHYGENAPQKQYEILLNVYNKPIIQLCDEDVASFQEIIENARVNKNKSVVLIGDELCDRGLNDYFTLLVILKLHKEIDLSIILSNHTMEFLKDYFINEKFTGTSSTFSGANSKFGQSLINMHLMIKKGLVQDAVIRSIVKECYESRLKIIYYSLSKDGKNLTVYTHGLVGLETIKSLVEEYLGPGAYDDSTPLKLINTIEQINKFMNEKFKSGKEFLNWFNAEDCDTKKTVMLTNRDFTHVSVDRPLRRLVSNRIVGDELISEPYSPAANYTVNFVLGHIGQIIPLQQGTGSAQGAPLLHHHNVDTDYVKDNKLTRAGEDTNVNHLTRRIQCFTSLELTLFQKRVSDIQTTNKPLSGSYLEPTPFLLDETFELISKLKENYRFDTPTTKDNELDSFLTAAEFLLNNQTKPIDDNELLELHNKLVKLHDATLIIHLKEQAIRGPGGPGTESRKLATHADNVCEAMSSMSLADRVSLMDKIDDTNNQSVRNLKNSLQPSSIIPSTNIKPAHYDDIKYKFTQLREEQKSKENPLNTSNLVI